MIDLHTHSFFSDGTLSPEELIAEAQKAGLTAIALTDHDTTAGLVRFMRAAEAVGFHAVPGVEISAEFPAGTLHLLGYFVRFDDSSLEESLSWIRDGRQKRNREILRKLNDMGISLTWDEVAQYAGTELVGRLHFARALVAKGIVQNKDEAFDRFLGKGKPAYAERPRFTPERSVALIRAAGGVAVLAHPFTLGLDLPALREFVRQLTACGLAGLEVYYPEHSPRLQEEYLRLAREFDLVPTGGTDFHGGATPDLRLGVGFGDLNVPEETLDRLAARI